MENLLNSSVDFEITENGWGTWRRFLYSSGTIYAEFTSHRSLAGWPLVHVSHGRSPKTGKITTARGVIAIGQKAVGLVAIGQAASGVIALGQVAVGLLVGVGQAATGLCAVGQFAAGVVTVAQVGAGLVGLSQPGVGFFWRPLWPK